MNQSDGGVRRGYLVALSVMRIEYVKLMATSESDAMAVAKEMQLERMQREVGERGQHRILDVSEIEAQRLPYGDSVDTITCQHCKMQSFREEWGPGHITCPHCKRVAFNEGPGT
jgi:hypothetical protein